MTAAIPLLLGAALVAACAGTEGAAQPEPQEIAAELDRLLELPGVRVVTQNLYVGPDVAPIIAAPLDQIPFVVAEGWADFLANRPADRMAAISNTRVTFCRPIRSGARLHDRRPADLPHAQPAAPVALGSRGRDRLGRFLILAARLARAGITAELALVAYPATGRPVRARPPA